MKRILKLNLGALVLVTFGVGCGGNSSEAGSGGASSSAGGPSANGGQSSAGPASGGAPATPAGGAHSSGGQTSNPGSGGAGPNGGFVTSVPGNTPLKDLTPDQLAKLCSDFQKYSDASLTPSLDDFACKATALTAAAQATSDAAAQAACKASLDGCTPDTATGTGMCTDNTPDTCTATVADLEVCANDTFGAVAALSAAVPSCIGMTLSQAKLALIALASSGNVGLTEPASCTKYDATCGSMTGMP